MSQDDSAESVRVGFTLRGLFVGVLVAALLSVGIPYATLMIKGSFMALDFSTPGALFGFFLLAGLLNALLRAIRPRFALSQAELITVYAMMLIACAICTMGLTGTWLSYLSGGFYYATPENEWAEIIHPYLPEWIVPHDMDAMKSFFEGLPKGVPIPWGAWLRPLSYWGILLIALYVVMICMMVILRKQWMEKERLIYPIVQVPLEMIREGDRPSLLPPFFRNPIMWAGFGIPLIVASINAFHNYYRFIPTIALRSLVPIFRRSDNIIFSLSFPMVGFSYLINLDVAFSLWFFNLFLKIQKGVQNITGLVSTEPLGGFGTYPANFAHQAIGALIVLVLFGLWIARGHLRDVFRSAFGRAQIDDSEELLSYRAAVWGTIIGLVVMAVWLVLSGVPAVIVPLFLAIAMLTFLAVTRVVVESGLANGRGPISAFSFVVSGVGTTALGPAALVSMGLSFVWAGDTRTFVMVSCAHAQKLADTIRGSKRFLFWAMIIATIVSILGSLWITMDLGYRYGGINLQSWFFNGAPRALYERTLGMRLTNPSGPHVGGWLTTAAGGGAMVLLMVARQRLLWWPLHPVGFPLAPLWLMDYAWFSIFLAWLIKAIILKYGGPRLFRTTRPFFLGLILGQFVCSGTWLIVDYFTGMEGNSLFWI